ncbi:MAG: hypothetical protein Ct9H300mP11_25390 [Chloroflexota bacterium]|nr:MAG: hypothetical protein Ct9H300mP11_25390 [Chloroflexota bacterium]
MIALGGICNVAGPNGTREIPVEDFCTAPGRNALENGELLVSISLPAPQANSGANYLRFIPRNEMDIAVAGVGSSVVPDGSGQNFCLHVSHWVRGLRLRSSLKKQAIAWREKPFLKNRSNKLRAGSGAAKPISGKRGTVRQRPPDWSIDPSYT